MALASLVLGLLLAIALSAENGNAQQLLTNQVQAKPLQLNGQTLLLPQNSAGGNVLSVQSVATPIVERRLSLEDFFLNRNNQQQVQPVVIQSGTRQGQGLQITRPQPNQLFVMRDTRFPSAQGGLLSRLIMARRMLRLQRIATRLSLIPQVLGLGQQLRQNELTGDQPQSLILLNNRIGQQYEEPYDPREYVFGNKAFSYGNTADNNQQQTDQNQQQFNRNQQQSDRNQQQSDRNQQTQQDYNEEPNSKYQSDTYEQQDNAGRSRDTDSYDNKENQNQYRNRQNLKVVNSNVNSPKATQAFDDYDREEPLQRNPEKLQNSLYQQNNLDQQRERVQEYLAHLIQAQHDLQNYNSQSEQERQLLNQQQRNQPNQQVLVNNQGYQLQQNSQDRRETSVFSPLGGIVVGAVVPDQQNVVHSNIGLVQNFKSRSAPTEQKIEPLRPLGLLPKPLLNLKGRLFFGAEMGKGVKVNSGTGH